VNPERRTLSRLTLPLKVLADRFAFGALVILSLALLAVGKANVHLLEGVSMRISDALVPTLQTLMQPVTASRRLVEANCSRFAPRMRG
jgi:rod shape-determining protein MreC